jgi:hypothetical protein
VRADDAAQAAPENAPQIKEANAKGLNMLPSITQTMQTATLMSSPDPIPEALLEVLLALREDPASKGEWLRLLALPGDRRRPALRNLRKAMEGDPQASALREALQAAEDPVLARAMAEYLRDH